MHRFLTVLLLAAWTAVVAAAPARADRLTDDDDMDAGEVRPFQHDEGLRTGPAMPAGDAALKIPPVFEELFPIRVKKLRELSSTHPDVYRRALRRMHRVAGELRDLKVTNLEEFNRRMDTLRLEGHAESVAARLRLSRDAGEQGVLEREVRTTLEKLFDKKEESQRAHVTRMEREVMVLKKKLATKHALRDKAIAKRLAELKEEDEDLDF